MSDTVKIAKNLQAFKIAVNSHDRENPDHSPAYGIESSWFDLERLGFDDGEELWPGITIYGSDRATGGFRVLCDFEEPRKKELTEEKELTPTIGSDRIIRDMLRSYDVWEEHE